MDHAHKLAFISSMTDKALTHVATSPNIQTPKGTMSHDKMLSFVQAMTKHGVQHMDLGGILGGAGDWIKGGGILSPIKNALSPTNSFQAAPATITPGTNQKQLNTAYDRSTSALNTQRGITQTLNGQLHQGADSQDALTAAYLNQINGQGPNPAQAALNQNTGQNIAQTAALMAGQRGAGTNAGLIASQAAQQGAATQQQAVGQEATLAAQQQLAAQQGLQNLATNQVNQGTGATQAYNAAEQGEQGILQNANAAANNNNVAMQSNLNSVNATVADANQKANSQLISGLVGAGTSAPVLAMLNKGGIAKPMKYMAEGGDTGPMSHAGKWVNSSDGLMEQGGQVDAESEAQKAVKSGDSIKNDKIPTMLSEGEIVIPRHITMSERAPEKAAAFVANVLSKRGK